MKRSVRITVRGKIQGVSYRAFAKEQAEKLHLEGTIQNNSDGTIIIDISGIPDILEEFIDALYEGSPKSHVESIEEEPLPQGRNFRGIFRIIGLS